MPLMVLNRNYILASLVGRTVNFHKGEPVWVIPEMVREALQIGAEEVENSDTTILGKEPEPQIPLTQEERNILITAAYPGLEATNNREDFTGQGVPSVGAVSAIVDFDVTTQERDDTWRAYVQAKSDAAQAES